MQAHAHANPVGTAPRDSALISARTIQGTKVFSQTREELGHIDDVMIDAATGKIVYGILQFGGFFGIGADFHPIPFGRLHYDRSLGGYTTDLTKSDLEGAPVADLGWREDRDWQQRSYDYYRVPPYWL